MCIWQCIVTLDEFVSTLCFPMCPKSASLRWCMFTLLAFVRYKITQVAFFTFLHYVFRNWFSNRLHDRMQKHTGCIYLTCRQCVFLNVSSNYLLGHNMHSHTGCRGYIITLVAIIRFVSTVGFQMSLQIAWKRGSKVTLFAFVWLSSTLSFQMSLQISCIRVSKVTLAAFTWLSSKKCKYTHHKYLR